MQHADVGYSKVGNFGNPLVFNFFASGITSLTANNHIPSDHKLKTHTQSTFGDRTFAVAALRLWNSLPPDLRQPGLSYGQFRRSLQTFLFGQ